MRQSALHPTAGGLEDVLAEQFCIKGRQLTVPIDVGHGLAVRLGSSAMIAVVDMSS